MSKKKLRTTRSEASERILKQIQKGIRLYDYGVDLIKNKYKQNIPTTIRDNFENEFNQWTDFTFEVLRELFESSIFAHEFKEKHSSEVKYVDSSWIPDIKYYLERQLIPKIDYLKILQKNIQEFDEELSNNGNNKKKKSTDKKKELIENQVEVDKMTIIKLINLLTIPQIIKIIGTLLAIIIGSFGFGIHVSGWKVDKQKHDLFIKNKQLNHELNNYKIKLDIISNKNDSLKKLLSIKTTKTNKNQYESIFDDFFIQSNTQSKKKTKKTRPHNKFGIIVEKIKEFYFPHLPNEEDWFESTFYHYYRITLFNNTTKPIKNIKGKIACNYISNFSKIKIYPSPGIKINYKNSHDGLTCTIDLLNPTEKVVFHILQEENGFIENNYLKTVTFRGEGITAIKF